MSIAAPATGRRSGAFFGRYVVAAAFVLAVFGWGAGFYGPPVFLPAVVARTGWSAEFVSGVVTVHFLCGALVIALLPRLFRRFGVARVVGVGVFVLAAGLIGWSLAPTPWLLVVAAVCTGAGWVTMGAAALNAIIAPWFVRTRPKALSMAYNGASIGGVILSPLWAGLIARYSFFVAAAVVAAVMVPAVLLLCVLVFARTPERMGQSPDGEPPAPDLAPVASRPADRAATVSLWRDRSFLTLAGAMALGLFAQIGLLTHLFSVLVPRMGDQAAGWVMASITAASIVGRFVAGRVTSSGMDRRTVAGLSYGAQLAGSLVLVASAGVHVPLLLVGSILFGIGVGNATSLPPLIAQQEFTERDTQRAVATAIAIAQGTYAFAPVAFGVFIGAGSLTIGSSVPGATALFIAAALVQGFAIGSVLIGRRRKTEV
jgi:MFS family permease